MASPFFSSTKAILILLIIFSCLHHFSVSCLEFEVGDTKGWVIPPANNTKTYNEWASKNRFQIGDTIRFKYEKDSVMVVTESEFNKCDSTHPMFFSNNGDTIFKFDRSGLFYFISGVSGHCKRGQKMIVKVKAPEEPPSKGDSDGAVPTARVSTLVFLQFVLSFLGSHLL